MNTLVILAIVVALIGVLGGLVPVIPGPPLSWVALLMVYLADGVKDPISSSMLVTWGIIALIVTVLDYVLPSVMTKVSGGSKYAERGAAIGLIAGLVLTPIGMIMGSFLGAFLGEFLFTGKEDAAASLKAAFGTFIAFLMTTGIKVICSAVMLWQILSHVI